MSALLLGVAAASLVWQIERRVDPMTDVATVEAVAGYQGNEIAIGCDLGENSSDEDPYIRVGSRQYLGEAPGGMLLGGRELTMRIDSDEPEMEFWDYWDHGAIQRRSRIVDPLLPRLIEADEVHLELVDWRRHRWVMSIEMPENNAVLRAVIEECGA